VGFHHAQRKAGTAATVAEFLQDDWRVAKRLTVNLGVRYTLNFPSTEVNNQGAVFNLQTQVLDFPHTSREVHWGDFGPRVGMAYRIGDNWVIRSGYGMVFFEQSGITTPFTIPQFPFVQTMGRQTQDNVNAAFKLSTGPTVHVVTGDLDAGPILVQEQVPILEGDTVVALRERIHEAEYRILPQAVRVMEARLAKSPAVG
jgi:hypothetical protein